MFLLLQLFPVFTSYTTGELEYMDERSTCWLAGLMLVAVHKKIQKRKEERTHKYKREK